MSIYLKKKSLHESKKYLRANYDELVNTYVEHVVRGNLRQVSIFEARLHLLDILLAQIGEK